MSHIIAIEKELKKCLKDNTELMCNDAYVVTKDDNRISFFTDDEIMPLIKKYSDNFDHIDFILAYQPYKESFEDTKKVYIDTKEKITKLNNQNFKYWNTHYDLDKMTNDDNTGWQFLCTQTISLKNPQILKGDDKMFEDLIARIRVYKAKSDNKYDHRPYELKLVHDDTQVFKNVNRDNDRNNCSKADFIFQGLIDNGVDDDNYDGSESNYDNVKSIEAIILANNSLYIDYHNLQYEPNYRGRDGWEICGIDLTRVIMYEFTLTDNTIIRFDFQGMIDNEKGTQGIYFQDIVDKNSEAIQRSERTKKLIEQIENEQDSIIELSASPVYPYPKTNFHKDSELVPNGDFQYMVEFFSTSLVCQDDDDYIGCFSEHDYNGKYIRDAMKLINDVEQRAKELADKYTDKGVKVTVNDFNQGCQYGMAVYVWIPSQ